MTISPTDIRPRIRPQPGPQTEFLSNEADIVLFGGSAGSGKTYGILLDALWFHDIPGYTAVIFRKNATQIRAPGGLWSSSQELFRQFEGNARESILEWNFPSNAVIKFAHLDLDKDVHAWQGTALTGIYWDELCHFSRSQFMYMLSRNRSTCGIKPYIRATCNPDSESWVREFIDWWINPDTGYAIPERSGKIRWFFVENDKIIWGDTKEELIKKHPDCLPKSFSFIASTIFDNKILLASDPGYLANLRALPKYEREQLLMGNWNIKPSAGMFFQRSYFQVVDAIPANCTACRYWDRAATRKTESNDPDYTVGIKLEKDRKGVFYVTDICRIQDSPLGVQNAIKNVASQDGVHCRIGIEQDPGQAGVSEVDLLLRMLAGYIVMPYKVQKDKITRASPVSAQAEAGNIKILKARWNEDFFRELENFPDGAHDDQCLIAGTMIATPFGEKPIQTIKENDLIITPFGVRKCLVSSLTGYKNVIKSHNISGTSNHPVFQQGNGFIPLDAISGSFLDLLSWNTLILWQVRKQLSLMESCFDEWAGKDAIILASQKVTKEESLVKVCILQFGNLLMEKKFSKAFKFITKTVIHSIMTLAIWSVYLGSNILGNLKNLIVKKCSKIWTIFDLLQKFGILPKRAENGILKMLKIKLELKRFINVLNVVKISYPKENLKFVLENVVIGLELEKPIQKIILAYFAIKNSQVLREVILEEVEKLVPIPVPQNEVAVYNLKIEGSNCYYANGVLVGNCDSLAGAFLMHTENKYDINSFMDN